MNPKKQIVLTCMMGMLYMVSQISRTDLSAVLVDLIPDLKFTKESISLAITAGYISYACGMMINSLISERVNPKLMICIAMFGCAGTHLGIRLFPVLPVIIVLWCINGFIQSMIWPSVLHLTIATFPPEKRPSTLNLVCVFQHIGSMSCYLIVPMALSAGGWRTMMLVTSTACLTCGFMWAFYRSIRSEEKTQQERCVSVYPLNWTFITKTHLIPLLLLCCMCGMLRDGIQTWAPTFFSETFSLNGNISVALTAILSFSAALSYAVIPFLRRTVKDIRRLSCALYFSCAVMAALLMLASKIASMTLALVSLAILLCLNGCIVNNYIVFLPLSFVRFGRTASISGILDCMIYVGSALASFLFASITQWGGWTATILSWIIIPTLGAGLVIFRKQLGPSESLVLPPAKNR